jgi:hypothetical protein
MTMTIEEQFQAYADDFELAYADDEWSRVGVHFSEAASYDSGDGSAPAQGRQAILERLKAAVDGLDRQMDERELMVHRVTSSDDAVRAAWTIRFTKGDLPVLELSGEEVARYSGDQIAELRSVFAEESLTGFAAWMQAHGGSL